MPSGLFFLTFLRYRILPEMMRLNAKRTQGRYIALNCVPNQKFTIVSWDKKTNAIAHHRCSFFVYFLGGLQCVGLSFARVAQFVFLRDVWIRTQIAAVTSRRATNLATHLTGLATHLPDLFTHLPELVTHLPDLAAHLPDLVTHLPDFATHLSGRS